MLRSVHVMGGLLHLLKDSILAADHAHHNILLAAVAAEAVSPGLRGILIQQEGGVAGMGHAEGAVISQGQLLGHSRGRVQNQEAGSGLQHGHINSGQFLDQSVRNSKYDHFRFFQGLLHRDDVQPAGMDAFNPLGGVFHQHQVILIRQLSQVFTGPSAHFSASADNGHTNFTHDPFNPFYYNVFSRQIPSYFCKASFTFAAMASGEKP